MMHMKNERGFVSLLTAILISLLLLVVTLSMVGLEVLQLHTADDAEQSMRAYYTAEAGVEDAVAKILSKTISTTTNQTCQPGSIVGASSSWTCQQITFNGQPTGTLKQDQAVTIEPGASTYQSVEIEWSQNQTDTTVSHYKIGLAGGFPSQAAFNSTHYAVPPVELQIVEYPDGGFDENHVCGNISCGAGLGDPNYAFTQNALIAPQGNGAGTGAVDYRTIYRNGAYQYGNCSPLPRIPGHFPNNINAGSISDYNCYVVITHLPAGKDYLFRLRSRYADSDYQFTFWSNPTGGVGKVVVPLGMATIDVTAQAGQVYRRVISNLSLTNGAESSLNYVMYSDTNVCKNFQVIDNAPPPPGACAP